MFTAVGMAAGGWLAGALYDHFGYYAPAFAVGIGANISQPDGGRHAGDAPALARGICLISFAPAGSAALRAKCRAR